MNLPTRAPAPPDDGELPTLAAYYDELARHDWYYDWSDDHSVWRRGQTATGRLVRIAQQGGPEYQALLTAWRQHMFTGPAWKNDRAPKPERPQ